jgi:tRNA_anti-like
MTTTNKLNWLHFAAGLVLIGSFFFPWVSWAGISIAGSDMPGGGFFKTSETKFGLENPFPQLSFAFAAFWLVPVLAALAITYNLLKKNSLIPSLLAGALSLSLVVVYFLFSKNLTEQGLAKSYEIKLWGVLQFLSAVLLIVTASGKKWLLKAGLILVTLAGTYIGFGMMSKEGEKKIFEKTFENTDSVKADYTLEAASLIKEFMTNDTATNKKYLEKVLAVNGLASAVDIAADSTSIIKFADSTGSYAIFSLEKNQLEKVQTIKAGDAVSVKGVCSGSIFSEILGTTSISFKRSTLNK